MPRSIPILVGAALIGAGMTFVAWKSSAEDVDSASSTVAVNDPAEGDPAETVVPEGGDDVELVSVDPAVGKLVGEAGGPAKSWEIIPMNIEGQMLKASVVRATRSAGDGASRTLTGEGRTRWDLVPSGEWTVVVEADGLPTWEKTLTLVEGQRAKTTAYLGEEIRLAGVVIDLNGKPVTGVPAYFLPAGVNHPRREEMESGSGDFRGRLVPGNGAVSVKLGAKGRFRSRLPKPGQWRFSVGVPGKSRWTQARATELKNGGPDSVTITIPAQGALRLTFENTVDERPTEVIAYSFDASRAARSAGGSAGGQSGRDPKAARPEVEARQRRETVLAGLSPAERASLKERVQRSGLEELDDWDPATDPEFAGAVQSRPADALPEGSPSSPFEAGWRALRSARVSSSGEVLLEKLPAEADLRFMFVRGQERIVTPGAQRLSGGVEVRGTVSLPPLGTGPPDPSNRQRPIDPRASVRFDTPEPGANARRVGVVWE